jgi:hypothetical protein
MTMAALASALKLWLRQRPLSACRASLFRSATLPIFYLRVVFTTNLLFFSHLPASSDSGISNTHG